MKLKEALAHTRRVLKTAKIEDASLEAEILLRHVLKIDRVQLYTELDSDLTQSQEQDYLKLIERRCRGEPSAYIIGHREFFGLDFIVNPNVLIPRPETELLVEKALEFAGKIKVSSIADVGTGCGAIAISLAINLRNVKVFALDASDKALEIAEKNRRKHGVSGAVELVRSDLLESLPEPVDMIIANLPYIKTTEVPETGPVRFEPRLALDGGPDGMAKIRRLCHQACKWLGSGGCLLLEIGQGQGKKVTALLNELFPSACVEVSPDFGGIGRVVCMRLT